MRLASYFIFVIFLLLNSHQSYGQTEEVKNKHALEVDLSVFTPSYFTSDKDVRFFSSDTVQHSIYSNTITELRLKYFHQFNKNISAFTGLHLGYRNLIPIAILSDTIFDTSVFSSANSSTIRYPKYEVTELSTIHIPYISLPIGIRVTGTIFRNDRVNFSLAIRTNIYSNQNLNKTETYFSPIRDEDIDVINMSSSKTNINTSLEGDLNYQWVSKKERFNIMIGIIMERNSSEIFDLQSTISSDSVQFPFIYNIRQNSYGAYIGSSFNIGGK